MRRKVVQTWHEGYSRRNVPKLLLKVVVPGGLVVVRSTDNVGIFLVDTGTVTALHDPDSAFSVSVDTSSKVNVYWSAANARFELQNNSGGARAISITYLGAA